MAFATAEDLVNHYNSLPNNEEKNWFLRSIGRGGSSLFANLVVPVPSRPAPQQEVVESFTVEHANEWLEKVKASYLQNRMSKGVRPWEVVDVCASLDVNQQWIGIEYETGYASQQQYRDMINFVWDNFLYSVIDYEGCGQRPCEITFAPVHAADFLKGDYAMDRLLAFGERNKIRQDRAQNGWCDECGEYHDTAHGMVGIHCNISTPSLRNLKNHQRVSNMLTRSVNLMHEDDQYIIFGRRPYGRFGAMRTSRGHQYMEGKLFDSTSDPDVWNTYKQTIVRIADLTEFVAANIDELLRDARNPHITNFSDILLGKATPEELELENEPRRARNPYADYDEPYYDPDDEEEYEDEEF